MVIESLKIKAKSNYNLDDIVYIYDFDVNLVKVIKRESRIRANIYYIGYVLEPENDNNSINPLYFVINRLLLLMFLMNYGNLLKMNILLVIRVIK